VSDEWIKNLAGITLPNVKITFYVDGKKQVVRMRGQATMGKNGGNVLCTHFGLSGPYILNSAKQVSDLLHEGVVTGTIDLFPTKDFPVLEKEILTLFDTNKNKLFKNVLKDIIPAGTVTPLLSFFTPALHEKKVHSVTKEERKAIVQILKALPFTVEGLMGFDRAVVADGGIDIAEIDTRSMRSVKYPNLYITGDVLNINRPTGGFGLQLCWTTGYVAGENA
jgi:predicted Rossmann fold flavoprotein